MLKLLEFAEHRLQFLMKPFWRWFYNFMAKRFQTDEWRFMNYGYAPPDERYHLEPEDEPNRYFIQLYAHLLKPIELDGKHILEVGCGRGGGCEWIARTYPLTTMTGLDLSYRAIQLCQQFYQRENLSFQQGDAECLPFADQTFDVVLNVESCQHYPNLPAFLNEVHRVLRPDGSFCVTVYRNVQDEKRLRKMLENAELKLLDYWEITPHVLRALDLTEEFKLDLLKRYAPQYLWPLLKNFSGAQGSELYQQFIDGELVYVSALLQRT